MAAADGVEVVVGEGEVLQLPGLGQRAEHVGDVAVQLVPGEVELLDEPQAAEGERDGSGDVVAAGVEHGEPLHQSDLVGEASREVVVEEEHLGEVRRRVVDGARDRAGELVVGHHQVLRRGAPEVVRDVAVEAVVVEEERDDGEVEHRRRHRADEAVEAEVEEEEAAERDDGGRERAGEVVVGEAGRAEAVAVEVDGRDGERGVVLRRRCTRRRRRVLAVEALVHVAAEVAVAEVGADPRRRHAARVAGDGRLERLDHRVQRLQVLVQEVLRRRRRRRRAATLIQRRRLQGVRRRRRRPAATRIQRRRRYLPLSTAIG
ncbi:hypothetical protein EE612_026177, partial [Oryza sativa]